MTERKKSVTEKDDPLGVETLLLVGNARDAQPLLAEFLKASQKFTQQLAGTVAAGGAMLETLARLAEHAGGDLGDGMKQIFEAQKAVEEHRHQVAQAWNDQVQADLVNRLPNDRVEIATWEKSYKTRRQTSVKALKKAEANQQKTNKPKARAKAPDKADEADRVLAEAVAEHDRLLRDELREVVRLQRKKYCRFLQQFGFLMDVQANMAQADLAALIACRNALANLPESEELITGKARLLLNDEGTPPPAYQPISGPPMLDPSSQRTRGATNGATAAQATEVMRTDSVPVFDPVASATALLDPLSEDSSISGSHINNIADSGPVFQNATASFVDYSQTAGGAPPLDDLLQDDLWNLVNGGGGGTTSASHIYSDIPPADADIAAALRDIDELAINL